MAYDDNIELKAPSAEKMLALFRKQPIQLVWKKVKATIKVSVPPEEKALFNKHYKVFSLALVKSLVRFDEGFPDKGKMKKTGSEVDKLLAAYDKKVADEPGLEQVSDLLARAVAKLQLEIKRRIVWVTKYVTNWGHSTRTMGGE